LEIAPHAQPAVEQICKHCGYLPLAIRAAGGLLAITPDLDPLVYATQLADERNRLEHIGAKGVERGVTASFNLSYEGLAPETARVFRLLSVFPGTFDAAATEVVCDDTEHAYLSDLVRRSLVLYDTSTKRYRLHDLARLFAGTKLSGTERFIGYKRFATHYKEVLATADELFRKGSVALVRGLALFDLEWGNIQAGHAWLAAQGVEVDDAIAQLAMNYPEGVHILYLRQHPRERICWLEMALAAARRLSDRSHEGAALGILGATYAELGETQRAIQFHEQYLAIAREVDDRRGEGIALGNLGNAFADLGNTERAIEFYEQALLIDRELGDRSGEGTDLGNLGTVYYVLGETQRAVEFYEEQLTIVRDLGDRRGEGNALGNLGVAYKKMGKIQHAIQFYEQQLAHCSRNWRPKRRRSCAMEHGADV
jgi:tetratricopeptide (TPR) repeat protein